MGNLKGKAYQYQWGSARELEDVRRYMMDMYPNLTGKVYGREHLEGVHYDKSVAKGVWLFELREKTTSA